MKSCTLICILTLFAPATTGRDDTQLESLVKSLQSKDDKVRLTATRELADLGPKAEPVIPQLSKLLLEGGEDQRLCAAMVLGKIGKNWRDGGNCGAIAACIDDQVADLGLRAGAA